MTDASPGQITILLDAADDVAVTRELLRRHDPTSGWVVVHPTPGAVGRTALAHDVLAALGRPVHLLPREQLGFPAPAWRAVDSWVTADRIEQLVVLRAHRLGAAGCANLVDLAQRTRVSLMLVCHASVISPALRAAVHDVEHQLLTALPAPTPVRARQASPVPRQFAGSRASCPSARSCTTGPTSTAGTNRT